MARNYANLDNDLEVVFIKFVLNAQLCRHGMQFRAIILDIFNAYPSHRGINLASFNSYNSILNAVQSEVTNGGLNYLSDLNSSCMPTFSSTQIPTN